jgi:hypothetical protein
MKNIFKTALISLAVTLLVIGFNNSDTPMGTAVTQITGSDKLSDLDTLINTISSELNAGKIEISTTTLPLITTLSGLTSASSLATIGTIATGVWNGTAIGVGYGGTGTTSPTSNYVMLGDGSNGLKVTSGLGTSGQFLTSNGAGSAPTWQTSSVDQSLDYTWTGHHIFSSLFATNASSTNATSTNIYASNTVTAGSLYSNGGITANATTTGLIASSWERVTGATALNTGNAQTTTATASCTSGRRVMGGGIVSTVRIGYTGVGPYSLLQNYPASDTTWVAQVQCDTGGSCTAGTLTAYAICINP